MKKLISLILAAVCISSLWTVSAYDVYYFYDEYGNPVFMFPDTFYEIIPDETPAEVDEPVAEEVPIEELFLTVGLTVNRAAAIPKTVQT